MKYETGDKTFTLRLPSRLVQALDARSRAVGTTRSSVIRFILFEWLRQNDTPSHS